MRWEDEIFDTARETFRSAKRRRTRRFSRYTSARSVRECDELYLLRGVINYRDCSVCFGVCCSFKDLRAFILQEFRQKHLDLSRPSEEILCLLITSATDSRDV